MSHIYLYNVDAGAQGFQRINSVLAEAGQVSGERVVLCMKGTWFNAPMSAALYAVLRQVKESKKLFLDKGRNASVERILSKNGFFPHLIGSPQTPDTYGTTIPFKVFHDHDEEVFNAHVNRYVTHHRSFPAASEALKRKINESLLELFVNACIHSQTRHGISTCGQFFPNRNRLEFCLADAGVGIHGNVRRLEPNLNDVEAIGWVLEAGHTTRDVHDGIPGGLGLKLLKSFIEMNNGRLILVSGCGYLELSATGIQSVRLEHPFPGTVAHVVIRTDDPCYYELSDSIPAEDELF